MSPGLHRARPLRSLASLALLAALALTLAGCRSHFVETTITNNGSGAVTNLQVDYPSATFGVSKIDPGQQFHYRFKIQGRGTAQITFVDPQGHSHQNAGFSLKEGQEGAMTITVFQNGDNVWAAALAPDNKADSKADTK